MTSYLTRLVSAPASVQVMWQGGVYDVIPDSAGLGACVSPGDVAGRGCMTSYLTRLVSAPASVQVMWQGGGV